MILKTQGHKKVTIFPASFPMKSFLGSQDISWFHVSHACAKGGTRR